MAMTSTGMTRGRLLFPVAATALAAAILVRGMDAAPSEAAPAAAAIEPPRLHRLTEAQYRATIADIFGPGIKLAGRPEPDQRIDGLLAAGTGVVSITPSGAAQYATIARGVAEQVVAPENRDRLVGCAPDARDPEGKACATMFFSRIGERLFRRPLSERELKLAVDGSLASAAQLGDFHAGLSTSLAGMMVDLPFLFQIDNYVRDPAGGLTLDSWSRASRLSYYLWNTTPDEELLRAARGGELMTPGGVDRQVDRLIASPRFEDGTRAFFDDFLRLDRMAIVGKDPILYPAFRTSVGAAAREQSLRTMLQLLVREKGDYREIFTTRRVAMNRTLSPLYRIPYAPADWSMIEMPEGDPRAGLLTQIAFLAMHSHEGRSSPTLRGLAIREILLCEHVPPPPANVNFTIVQDVGDPRFKTARERLVAHLDDEDCASCHRKTDHLGLGFEKFDGAGQFRATEGGAPIDTSGDLDGTPFSDPVSLGRALHDSPKTTRCVAQAAWQTAAGRTLSARDGPFVDALHGKFARGGYRIAVLFGDVAKSPAFFAGPGSPALRMADTSPATLYRKAAR